MLLQRNGEEELGPRPGLALEVDLPAHALDDGFGDDETEPRALGLGRLVLRGLTKRNEDANLYHIERLEVEKPRIN